MSEVIGNSQITLSILKDIESQKRYYFLTDGEPPSTTLPIWSDSEPDYIDMDKTLYYFDRTVFSNGEVSDSEVSISSTYEAAKEASTMASEYLTPIPETAESGPKLQIHYSPDSITRTEITDHSYDVHVEDDDGNDVLAASFGIPQSFVKGEHSEFDFRGDGIGIKDDNGYDYFQVYKTPGGEPADEEKVLGTLTANASIQYVLHHDYSLFTNLYLDDADDHYYFYNDGTIGYVSGPNPDYIPPAVGGDGGEFTPPPVAGLNGLWKSNEWLYRTVGTWTLTGRVITITPTVRLYNVSIYVYGKLNAEAMMRVKGSVRESLEVVDVLMSANTGSVSDIECYRVGQLVHLYFMYHNPSSWSNGGEREVYVDLGPLPVGIAKGTGRFSGSNFVANFKAEDGRGVIAMQNCGSSVASGKNVAFQVIYITDDDTTYGNTSIGGDSTGGGGISSAAVREIIESYNYLDRVTANQYYQQFPYEDDNIEDEELTTLLDLIFS